jgi:hypothetical protein
MNRAIAAATCAAAVVTMVACSSSSGGSSSLGATPIPMHVNGTDLSADVPSQPSPPATYPKSQEQAKHAREVRRIGVPISGLDADMLTGWAVNTCREIGRSSKIEPLVKYVTAEFQTADTTSRPSKRAGS